MDRTGGNRPRPECVSVVAFKIDRDLFGLTLVSITFGRISAEGRTIRYAVDDESAAFGGPANSTCRLWAAAVAANAEFRVLLLLADSFCYAMNRRPMLGLNARAYGVIHKPARFSTLNQRRCAAVKPIHNESATAPR